MSNIRFHQRMIEDTYSRKLFEEALRRQISPGDIVADLGAGSGILSMFAIRAGADRVYAIEVADFIDVAREIVAANGMADRIVCIQADAGSVELPEKVDLVYGDMTGVAGIEGNLLNVFKRFADNNLKPTGAFLPSHIDVYCAPFDDPEVHAPVSFWSKRHFGFDFSPCVPVSAFRLRNATFRPEGQLAEAAALWKTLVGRDDDAHFSAQHTFEVTRDGACHGFAIWFVGHLTRDVQIHTGPDQPEQVWRQGYLALEEPLSVQAGDAIAFQVEVHRAGSNFLWSWSGEVTRREGEPSRFDASTFRGAPVGRRALRIMLDDALPKPSTDALASIAVLEGMRAGGSARAVARGLRERFPERFGTLDSALNFVALTATSNAR